MLCNFHSVGTVVHAAPIAVDKMALLQHQEVGAPAASANDLLRREADPTHSSGGGQADVLEARGKLKTTLRVTGHTNFYNEILQDDESIDWDQLSRWRRFTDLTPSQRSTMLAHVRKSKRVSDAYYYGMKRAHLWKLDQENQAAEQR